MPTEGRKVWFLKEWRTYRGLSQQRLADMIESSKSYISDLEKGERRYNQDLLEALAGALQCEPAELLTVNPAQREAMEAFQRWMSLRNDQRARVLRVINALDDTGTDG